MNHRLPCPTISLDSDLRNYRTGGSRYAQRIEEGIWGRWSVRRRVTVVLELLRGAELEATSREYGVTAATLTSWRKAFLSRSSTWALNSMAAVTALLAMFFLGFQEPLRKELLGGAAPVRSDLHLAIIAESEAAELVPQMTLSDEEPFGVTRPSSFDDNLPTYVLYRDGLLERSGASDVGWNELLGMLALVLVEVVFQLLRKEVDVGTLMPVIRQIVTRLA